MDTEKTAIVRIDVMSEYHFTLTYYLAPEDRDVDAVVERLGEARCNDALVGLGIVDRLALDFTREATTERDAVYSALADVKNALPSATLIEVFPLLPA
jgi:hypothetical protein